MLLTLTALTLSGCLTKADPDDDGRRAPTVDERTDATDDTGDAPPDDTAGDSGTSDSGTSDSTPTDTAPTDTAPPEDSDEPTPTHSAPAIGAIVITEIMAHPSVTSDADGEWLEVTNTSDERLTLEDCVLWQQPSFTCELLDLEGTPVLLEPGDILTLCANTDAATNGGVPCDGSYVSPERNSDCGLGNGGDAIAIECEDRFIDAVEYGETQLIEGSSLGVDPSAVDASDNDNALKWCPQISPMRDGDFGTPGAENDSCY